ncbi:flagellar hook-basal body complex protein FliE [Scopulibacillus daqui]|uniref:Flagellar hook-basal body complex protein FliE n=1 Tax=Scopulibacillus daqui TaxID=1469162 RepID=A0ABS2PWA2_9BACL|nr:flagellar hook-basal body complex protein FliE [Scopulibacillus daqui]MBM7644353.1 flagellar hook-basal body complex protein FliE [Scopulibacillus daqui]
METISVSNANTQTLSNKQSLTSKENTAFTKVLDDAIDKLNQAVAKSDQSMSEIASGKVQNLHNEMINIQKSNILLQTAVEVRNKVIDAYQDIMRMQI